MYLKPPLKWIFCLIKNIKTPILLLKKPMENHIQTPFCHILLVKSPCFFPESHIFPRWPRRQEACVIKATACPGPVDCSPLTVVAKDYKGAVDPDDPDGYRWLFGDWLHEPWGMAIGKMMKHGDRIGIWQIWIGFGKIFTGNHGFFPWFFLWKMGFFLQSVPPIQWEQPGFFGDWIHGYHRGFMGNIWYL